MGVHQHGDHLSRVRGGSDGRETNRHFGESTRRDLGRLWTADDSIISIYTSAIRRSHITATRPMLVSEKRQRHANTLIRLCTKNKKLVIYTAPSFDCPDLSAALRLANKSARVALKLLARLPGLPICCSLALLRSAKPSLASAASSQSISPEAIECRFCACVRPSFEGRRTRKDRRGSMPRRRESATTADSEEESGEVSGPKSGMRLPTRLGRERSVR